MSPLQIFFSYAPKIVSASRSSEPSAITSEVVESCRIVDQDLSQLSRAGSLSGKQIEVVAIVDLEWPPPFGMRPISNPCNSQRIRCN
jgi:hypothetical protein